MSSPIISVAGIRGIVGDSLPPDEFLRYVLAFASTRKGGRRIAVGGDSRISRAMYRRLVFAGLESMGFEAIDLGVCPTPTVGLMTRETRAAGGIAITASHNPAEWNALKFFSGDGVFLDQDEFNEVLAAREKGAFRFASWDALGRVAQHPDPVGPHLERVLAAVDARAIRQRKLKVAADLCNGAGTAILPRLFRLLDVEAECILTDINAPFERGAEPLPENLGALCNAVRATGADLGLAVDPDADRLALVDESGRPIGEERTLTLCADHWLKRETTPIVANLSTTRALDDVAARHGVKVHRTKIGEAHVVAAMKRIGAAIGGEGNGGVIAPSIHPGRDAAAGAALILEALAKSRMKLSELNATIPDYAIVKSKVSIEGRNIAKILPQIEQALGEPEARSDIDGLKLEFANGWVHVRASGTEPIIRIFAEAATEEIARHWIERIEKIV
ncbi:MAG: Phosphoglucosamine mutase [candidate division BRC1 bacterium ADurb.BinA364]|nr:MAG: Phosphoglucosamine mutase [candidate division BRC1 bacterium ADurb.BinA364]